MVRRILPLLALTSLLAVACGGKGLGTETTGQAIRAATGYNLRAIDPEDRNRKPSFSGETMGGERWSSAELAGKVAVVNFWASWCGPCRKEQANLEDLWKRYATQGVVFVGVDTRDTKADGRAFIEEFGVTYPSLFDRASKVAFTFRVSFMPSTFVLDREGRIAAVITGATTDERQLSEILDAELAR